ncbi:MAG: hypothetical protein ACXABY_04030 [Candidatus Thorarchaeota archaeon]|jgi:hypothetical protein
MAEDYVKKQRKRMKARQQYSQMGREGGGAIGAGLAAIKAMVDVAKEEKPMYDTDSYEPYEDNDSMDRDKKETDRVKRKEGWAWGK